jgi:dTMP kinase
VNEKGRRADVTPGRFIVMEGGEGVGKTTQWQQLTLQLLAAGERVVALREPGGTPAGDVLRSVLLDPSSTLAPNTEALLFAASRAQLVETVIRPALAEDATVLVDRFLLSTYAYQGAGRGIPIETLRAINHVATSGVVPDLTLLLTMPLDDALARVNARGGVDRMEREDRAFHTRVHEAFLHAASVEWQAKHPEIGSVVTVDARGAADEVSLRLAEALAARWPSRFGALLSAREAMNTKVEVARG